MTALRFRALWCLIPALTVTTAAPAMAFDASDRSAVLARVEAFQTAVQSRDYAAFVTTLPPKLISFMAEQTGMDTDTLKQAMTVQITEAMASVMIDDFSLDTTAMTEGDTRTGRPYAILPTLTSLKDDAGAPHVSRSTTLALKDGAGWYLVRLEGPAQIEAVRKAYPDFSGVNLMGPAKPEAAPPAHP